jgi:hypothetical protein
MHGVKLLRKSEIKVIYVDLLMKGQANTVITSIRILALLVNVQPLLHNELIHWAGVNGYLTANFKKAFCCYMLHLIFFTTSHPIAIL